MTQRAIQRIENALRTGATVLDLSGLYLRTLPEELTRLPHLTELYLGENWLYHLPEWLADFTELSVLSLRRNQMRNDPEFLSRLTGLTVLELGDSSTPHLPEWLTVLPRLTSLRVGTRRLAELPGWIGSLTGLRELCLKDNSLSTLPESMPELTVLDVRNNHFRTLPEDLAVTLEKLWVSGNGLGSIPGIGRLVNLTSLKIGRTDLHEIPEEIASLARLTELVLTDNNITRLPDWLWEKTTITRLGLGGCNLWETPDRLAEFHSLTELVLDDNPIGELPEWLPTLTGLRSLSVSNCELREAPEWLGKLSKLTSLNLGFNNLRTVPGSIGDLRELTCLYLYRNELRELPSSLANLTKVVELDLSWNELRELPGWITGMTSLVTLKVQRNHLGGLPEDLGVLTGLELFRAEWNKLRGLPRSIGGLKNLSRLLLDHNLLEELPDSVSGLTGLVNMSARGNILLKFPDGLAELSSLRVADLSSNLIGKLPGSISNMTSLIQLNLEHNKLTALPEGMSGLTALNQILLGYNELTDLPHWLADLPDLDLLAVAGNPLQSPPPEIVAAGSQSVLAFLRARWDGVTQLWTSKLLIVGEGGVGKTSVVKALSGSPFDPDEPSTHGLRINQLRMQHPRLPRVKMDLNAWDFGGQQIYHATHQFFLTNRSLFVLLWNARLGWEQGKLRYWLDIITARAPESPIILVATHVGDRPVDLPLDDLRREYPRIVDSLSVDNETREGTSALGWRLTQEAADLPLMGAQWPSSWLAAADAVLALPVKHITPEQLRREMTKAGVTDPVQQDYIAVAMHELGDILFYRDDPELCQTIVLRPEWVNEYISKVLDSHEVAARQGLLARSHLNSLWADLDRGLRDHFLGMMDKYDLSYRVEDSTDVSLVVERLPWNAPPYQPMWDAVQDSQQIRVLYRLNTMPPGIPTWFIARSHRFSTSTHWRTGAVLRNDRHLALIRADAHRNTVELTVRGPAPAAFFSILDDGLNRTLERFPGLHIERQVPCSCRPGCPELYNYEDLSARLSRTPPRHEIECRKSGDYVDVRMLLLGLAPSERDAMRMTLDQVSRSLTRLDDKLTEQAEYNQRMFLRLQHIAQVQQETRCPSIFTLVPAKSRIATTRYELRLYCEEPGAWHRLPEPDGIYPITRPRDWFRKAGPYLTGLIKVLQHATPLVKPILGISVDQLTEQLKSDCDLMKELISQLPTDLPDDLTYTKRAETDADFRVLEAMLVELDPERAWGGLSRTTTPEGLTLYLCRDHLKAY
jgi:internalin A